MIGAFNGPYRFTKETLDGWNSNQKGVYYLGARLSDGSLLTYYVGKGTSPEGIRGRLRDHLHRWRDVTHFGYVVCSTVRESENFEINEIQRLNPKYNQANKL